ncbi:MAG: VWA domain-containing protein [Acidimicrobiales bacterium]
MKWKRRRARTANGGSAFTYSQWDGTQVGFELKADDLFAEMTDDLLYHGDLNAAMRRMMQDGFETRDGEQLQGLREMLEQLRERRQEALDEHDLGGVYDEIANELREVIETEREALGEMLDLAGSSDDGDAAAKAQNGQIELDMLPPDLAGQMKGLLPHDFASDEAREQFEKLVEKLREQLMQNYVDQAGGAMNEMSSDDFSRMKDMMSELNQMLESHQKGEPTDFEGFMERHGDFFPEDPKNIEELLETMARRMAAMQAMLNSMTPEQRQQMQDLSDAMLEDMDLRWQMDQLGENLRDMFPGAGWEQSYEFGGVDPLDLGSAGEMFRDLGDLDQLENMLRGARSPGALAEVDIDRARELMGDDAANSLDRMAEIAKMLEDAGYLQYKEGRYELTARAIRKIGQNALGDLFRKLSADKLGQHSLEQTGFGHERAYETKEYEYGDPFNLHIGNTVRNAVTRSGGGTPVKLLPEDFEVERNERSVRSSTVLMLDLSLSMPMRDNFLPAKKVAMALHSLISTQYPRDYMGVVTFAAVAHEIKPEELPEVSWDYDYGTNMQHGFQLARQMLARQSGTKQIIMITDGEPTAHLTASGAPLFNYPPSQETVDLTMKEVMRCTREDIRINTFMLDATTYLTNFIERISKLNGGRAFFTTNENIGDYVLVDFVENRRKLISGR